MTDIFLTLEFWCRIYATPGEAFCRRVSGDYSRSAGGTSWWLYLKHWNVSTKQATQSTTTPTTKASSAPQQPAAPAPTSRPLNWAGWAKFPTFTENLFLGLPLALLQIGAKHSWFDARLSRWLENQDAGSRSARETMISTHDLQITSLYRIHIQQT